MDEERLTEVYDYLVDETENPSTARNQKKSELLGKLLPLMEYLLGNEDENPVPEWFE